MDEWDDDAKDYDVIVEFLTQKETEWSWIEITEKEISQLIRPQQELRGGILRVYEDGDIKFIEYGKYTGEEFFTSEIKVSSL